MPGTSSWKGYLKLSLVSCSVAMAPAQSDREKVRFHTMNRETGNRLKQQLIDAKTGDVVERSDLARGYEVGKDEYIIVEDEDFEKIALDTKQTIDIEEFVPVDELDPLWMGDHHYIWPDDDVAEEAFAVIRDAMEVNKVAGIARVFVSKRERWVAVRPRGKGILLTTLRYKYEVRSEEEAFSRIGDAEPDEKSIEAGRAIIKQMTGKWDASGFVDHYQAALQKIMKAKQKGHEAKAVAPSAPSKPTNVTNLFDALRKSIDQEKGTKKPKAAGRKKSAA